MRDFSTISYQQHAVDIRDVGRLMYILTSLNSQEQVVRCYHVVVQVPLVPLPAGSPDYVLGKR